MDESEILTATEASRAFSEVLHRVCYRGESFTIKKGNRLMARIVPVVEQEAPKEQKQAYEQPQETISPAAKNIFSDIVASASAPPPEATPDEAEYFKTVLEQLRRPVLEDA